MSSPTPKPNPPERGTAAPVALVGLGLLLLVALGQLATPPGRRLLAWLADTSMGPPGPRGQWPAWLSVLFHGSAAVIALGCFWAPWMVARQWSYRRDGVSLGQVVRAVGFMPAIGLSFAVRVAEAGGTPYHLTALADCHTACWVVYSVSYHPRLWAHVLRLPSRREIHETVGRLHTARLQTELLRLETEDRYAALRKALERHTREAWAGSKTEELAVLEDLARKLG